MNEQPTLSIPRDVIEPIIQAHVTSAVMAALVSHEDVVRLVVKQTLDVKVDNEGKHSSYTNSSSPTWIQWAMRDAIKKAARQAIEDYLTNNADIIKAGIAAELQKKNSPLARHLIEGMTKALTDPHRLKYGISVTVAD